MSWIWYFLASLVIMTTRDWSLNCIWMHFSACIFQGFYVYCQIGWKDIDSTSKVFLDFFKPHLWKLGKLRGAKRQNTKFKKKNSFQIRSRFQTDTSGSDWQVCLQQLWSRNDGNLKSTKVPKYFCLGKKFSDLLDGVL